MYTSISSSLDTFNVSNILAAIGCTCICQLYKFSSCCNIFNWRTDLVKAATSFSAITYFALEYLDTASPELCTPEFPWSTLPSPSIFPTPTHPKVLPVMKGPTSTSFLCRYNLVEPKSVLNLQRHDQIVHQGLKRYMLSNDQGKGSHPDGMSH